MFPINIAGRLEVGALTPSDSQAVLASMKSALEANGAANVSLDGDTLTFRAGLLQPRAWFARMPRLGLVDGGTIQVAFGAPGLVTYRFPTLQLVAFLTATLLLTGTAMPFGFNDSLQHLAFVWCVLVTGNYAFAVASFHRFLSRMAQPRVQAESSLT